MITILLSTPWPQIEGLGGEFEWSEVHYVVFDNNSSLADTGVILFPATHGDCQEILDHLSNNANILDHVCNDNEEADHHELTTIYKSYIVAHYTQGADFDSCMQLAIRSFCFNNFY